jgi:hypothetical protein
MAQAPYRIESTKSRRFEWARWWDEQRPGVPGTLDGRFGLRNQGEIGLSWAFFGVTVNWKDNILG